VALVLGLAQADGDLGGAGDRASLEVDGQRVLGELPTRGDRWSNLGVDAGAGLLQPGQQVPGAIGGIAIDRQRIFAAVVGSALRAVAVVVILAAGGVVFGGYVLG
jgi:hypothetical protein